MSKHTSKEALLAICDNQFVKTIKGDKIEYTKDFYVVLYKKLEAGMKAAEAYESMGFNVKSLGKDRANAAAQRAKIFGYSGDYTINPDNYDGSVARDKMGDLSTEEELAYYKARTMYLEVVYEIQKKIPYNWEEVLIYLKRMSLQ